jgi:uncharacterized protein YbjT (DUF2867 family)
MYCTGMTRSSSLGRGDGPVLVTGATGNVGRQVVRLLLAAGEPVRAAARSRSAVVEAFGDTVEAVALDFTDPGTWDAAYIGVRRMFLLRPPHLARPRTQMVPSLERAGAVGVEHMVLLSLQGAERNPVVPHAALERWLRRSGLSWTFVRASFFMQNLTTVHVTDIRDRDQIVVPAGGGATAFVDAHDVAAVAAAAVLDPAEHRDRAWTPTGPQALTYAEVAASLSRALGRPITYTRPGVLTYARHAQTVLGMPTGMVLVTTAIYTAARLGRADGLTNDVSTVLGRPPVSFDEFAHRERSAWIPS